MDDSILLRAAYVVSLKSKDPSTKTGAVVVPKSSDRIKGSGCNSFPKGVKERWENREEKYPRVVHAEVNAILNAGDVKGCTLYATHPPCSHCAGVIIQAGITKVVYGRPSADFRSRWNNIGIEMLEEAGVEVHAK